MRTVQTNTTPEASDLPTACDRAAFPAMKNAFRRIGIIRAQHMFNSSGTSKQAKVGGNSRHERTKKKSAQIKQTPNVITRARKRPWCSLKFTTNPPFSYSEDHLRRTEDSGNSTFRFSSAQNITDSRRVVDTFCDQSPLLGERLQQLDAFCSTFFSARQQRQRNFPHVIECERNGTEQ